jgi:hypothetical protein
MGGGVSASEREFRTDWVGSFRSPRGLQFVGVVDPHDLAHTVHG